MTMIQKISILILATVFFIGCDKVNDPFANPNTNNPNPEEAIQKVLLEDFTGFRCPNCPPAAAVASQLSDVYGDNLIVVGIHCTNQFASPLPTSTSPDDPFYNDYRTPAGEAYWPAFGIQGLPTGLVNRAYFDGIQRVAHPNWANAIAQQLALQPKASIVFENHTYDESTRTVNFDVSMTVLENLEAGQYFMTLYLTEDSIYDWQDNQGTLIENFLHRHVLRDNINGTWGALAFNNGTAGQNNTLSYQYTLDTDWNAEHCEIVAYIYREETREIIQAEKIHAAHP
jgi:thiol-disulfide isomerase/thioredoxin